MIRLLAIGALLLFASQVLAEAEPADTTKQEQPKVDTLLVQPGNAFPKATPVTDERNFEAHLVQNPTAALFKSMVLPGLGQIGNHAYTKAAFFAGLDGLLIYAAVKRGGEASDLYGQFKRTDSDSTAARNNFYDRYRGKARSRNAYTWLAVVTTVVAMFDAYVDAHLSGSPKNQNGTSVSIGMAPPIDGTFAASVQISF
jgi:Family of unknown function (DUF5683)